MGLDLVEFVIAVEDRFGITISDDEAGRTRTVGDLYTLILSKLDPPTSSVCLTSHAFYRIRHTLAGLGAIPRGDVTPSTRLEGILPTRPERRVFWHQFEQRLQWKLPPLRRSSTLVASVAIPALLVIATAAWSLALGVLSALHAWITIATVLAGCWFVALATRPLAVCFPSNCSTVGQMAEAMVTSNFAKIMSSSRAWTPVELWSALQATVIDELGVRPEQVTEDARFVEDLGAD